MSEFIPITGTFLDGVCVDIPSQNWNFNEWDRQFKVFTEMGIDSVIIIRVGWKDMAMYKSKVMPSVIHDPNDRVALFLELAAKYNLKLYIGMYDSFKYWLNYDSAGEASVNLELISELIERYGDAEAFYGWYLSHEPALAYHPWEVWNPLIAKMKLLTPDKAILLSPRFEAGKGNNEGCRTPIEYAKAFDHVLEHTDADIEAAAFMDGHAEFEALGNYFEEMNTTFRKYPLELWSNLETFDRDMPIKFPPIDWLKMRYKLETVQPFVSKIITFEAPHFLSPYSMWESGRKLFECYMKYIDEKKEIENVKQ